MKPYSTKMAIADLNEDSAALSIAAFGHTCRRLTVVASVSAGRASTMPSTIASVAGQLSAVSGRRRQEPAGQRRQRRHFVGLERAHEPRRDQHHQLGALGASALLLNRLPMIGIWLRIGTAAASSCVRLSSSPAIANDWPSRSSTLVSARRVDSAGMRNPCSVMPLPKSSVLTSAHLQPDDVAGDRRP